MKLSFVVFCLAAFAGGLVALAARSSAVRANGCDPCSDPVICGTHFADLDDAGQGQDCCNAPNNPTDKLFFTITRQSPSACTQGRLIATDTAGAICGLTTHWKPQPNVGILRCWNGTGTVSYTETYLVQRCCDADDGELTVEFRGTGGSVCGDPEINVFSSAQTELCEDCTNPGVCTDSGMCEHPATGCS